MSHNNQQIMFYGTVSSSLRGGAVSTSHCLPSLEKVLSLGHRPTIPHPGAGRSSWQQQLGRDGAWGLACFFIFLGISLNQERRQWGTVEGTYSLESAGLRFEPSCLALADDLILGSLFLNRDN